MIIHPDFKTHSFKVLHLQQPRKNTYLLPATTKSTCSNKRGGWWHNLGWFSPNSHAIPSTWFPYLVLIDLYTRIFRLACFVIENTDLKICIPRSNLFPTYSDWHQARSWLSPQKLQGKAAMRSSSLAPTSKLSSSLSPSSKSSNTMSSRSSSLQSWLTSCFCRLNGYVAGYGDQVNEKNLRKWKENNYIIIIYYFETTSAL